MEKQQAEPTQNPGKSDGAMPDRLILIPGRFPTLAQAETAVVQEAIQRANGNQGVAATLLGISRPALNRRLARLHSTGFEDPK
ncbi:MAG TPA: helix-turn-helix domain-containing protein [Gammaproteobacteria bacterium]|nr:helix-turn-helix domain-containing protein [Gammaproteobacteria bacterium]